MNNYLHNSTDLMHTAIMNSRTLLISVAVIFMSIVSLKSEIISDKQLKILRKRAILQSYNDRFHISNVTFACDQTDNVQTKNMISQLLSQDKVLIRRVRRLEEEDMQQLLRHKGGTFMPEYLASDTASAETNFPDAKAMRFRRSFLAQVARLRKKWRNLQQVINSTTTLNPSKSSLRNMPAFDRFKAAQQSRTNGKSAGKFGQLVSKLLTNTKKTQRRRRQLDDPLFPADDPLSPSDDSTSKRLEESCSQAGEASAADSNYLHLCNICSSKRLLPIDRYPRVINEVYCKPAAEGCLGGGNGKCIATIFNVHLLKRREGICRLCVKDSQALAVDEWETYVEPISVGCECMLDKASAYRQQWFARVDLKNSAVG